MRELHFFCQSCALDMGPMSIVLAAIIVDQYIPVCETCRREGLIKEEDIENVKNRLSKVLSNKRPIDSH